MIVTLSKEEKQRGGLGNKGEALLKLKQAGFDVPEGFILDAAVYERVLAESGIAERVSGALASLSPENAAKTAKDVRKLFETAALPAGIAALIDVHTKAGVLYAVRSSANMEDLEGSSFAGQYESFLNTKREDVASRVIDCYRSMFSEGLLQYAADRGIDALRMRMSVVIQEMVDADRSGICFTIDPVSGLDKEMLIEVSEGLGEAIVSGRTAPERYRYDWFWGRQVEGSDANRLLSAEEVQRFADVFSRVQQLFGYPCDIEFAIAKGRLWLLQARPITRIGFGGIKDLWTTADFKDGGVSATVCTPYMWSLYEYIWEIALRDFLVSSRLLSAGEVPEKLGEMFYGRPYWNMSAVKKAMSRVIGYKEREFDEEYGIAGSYEGDGEVTRVTPRSLLRNLCILVQQKRFLRRRMQNAQRYKDELLALYGQYKQRYDEGGIADIRADFTALSRDVYLRSESTYFWQIFLNTVHQSIYKDSLLQYVSESEYLSLLGSIDDISHLRPFYEMWDASRRIRSDKEALAYWKKRSASQIAAQLDTRQAFLPLAKELIARYGYHSDRELDITCPCYYEEPQTMLRMMKDMVMLEDAYSPHEDRQRGLAAYRAALEQMRGKAPARAFAKMEKKIAAMREMLWWREEFRDISTRFYYLLRVYTMALARELTACGDLEREEDVWFVKVRDLWAHLDGTLQEDLRTIARRNRRYYQAYRNYQSDNEIGTSLSARREERRAEASIRGLGANNGVACGTARVIEDVSQIDRLREGDILVTRFTDTGWTPKFAILSGIVTEYGGILCHAAIVSREYGIPAIVCCEDAMKRIRDGQTIRIDGSSGSVDIVQEAER